MSHNALATTDSPTDLAMVACDPLLDALADALAAQGIRVQRPTPQTCAWQAFLQGAVLCVLAPAAQETPEQVWQSLADRAAQLLPISVAALPEARRTEQGDWLAAGLTTSSSGLLTPRSVPCACAGACVRAGCATRWRRATR